MNQFTAERSHLAERLVPLLFALLTALLTACGSDSSTSTSSPIITTQPADLSVVAGDTATFTVAATGNHLGYQWQASIDKGITWTAISSATSSSYTTPPTTITDTGTQFRVQVTAGATVSSSAATLTVTTAAADAGVGVAQAPAITAQPASQSVTAGSTATFTATATGNPTPTLQWQTSIDAGANWIDIGGATSASYTTPATVIGDNGAQFRLRATNREGTANSNAATLTVTEGLTVNAKVAPLSLGINHACALKADRTVACWGSNAYGELGDGTTTDRLTPVTVSGLSNVAAVVAGYEHSCALKTDGTVACWGHNQAGQLGDGTTLPHPTPMAVSGVSGVVAITGGNAHVCGLKAGGTVTCWGFNSYGQLGNGKTATIVSTAVEVSNLTDAVAITAGANTNCALRAGGTVVCWGDNRYGGIGDGSTTNRTTPVAVSGLSGAVAVAAGTTHGCAIKTDKTVVCWGENGFGQLGDGTTTDHLTPVTAVSDLTDAVAIDGGVSHHCAIKSDGKVVCWGRSEEGQLGDGTYTFKRTTPVAVSGLTDAVVVTATWYSSCALKADGTVACWGWNPVGQLGDGTKDTTRLAPVEVSGGAIFWKE